MSNPKTKWWLLVEEDANPSRNYHNPSRIAQLVEHWLVKIVSHINARYRRFSCRRRVGLNCIFTRRNKWDSLTNFSCYICKTFIILDKTIGTLMKKGTIKSETLSTQKHRAEIRLTWVLLSANLLVTFIQICVTLKFNNSVLISLKQSLFFFLEFSIN